MIGHRVFGLIAGILAATPCPAAVVAFLNATDQEVAFTIEHPNTKPVGVTLAAGESRAVSVGREPILRITLNGKPAAFKLDPYTPYLFIQPKEEPLSFSGVELAGNLPKPDDVPVAPAERKPVKVPVALFADAAQPLTKTAWEQTTSARFTEAAKILEKQAGVAFTVMETKEWTAAKEAIDWLAARTDFERNAQPKDGLKAVGFISRTVGHEGFGACGEPGCSHLIIQDGLPKAEGERVEVLVHHLALCLGAVRSPDRGSVMRAKLGDGQALRKGHRIQFDPINLIILNVWAEEWAAGKGAKFTKVSPKARDRLVVLYRTMAEIHDAMKTEDQQPRDYSERLALLRENDDNRRVTDKPAEREPIQRELQGADAAVRAVVQAVTAKAKELANDPARPKGDALTAEYVKVAAEAAAKFEEKVQSRGFLIGLGIALDDSTILRNKPIVKEMCVAAESDAERKERIAALGLPTMRGRRDLCQHFVVSAALTELLGAAATEFAGLSKELSDMKGTSGFSFADLAADLSGIEFATVMAKEPKRIAPFAQGFTVADHMPEVKSLPEGLSEARFKKDYGGSEDIRFKKAMDEVRTAVKELPGYKK